tara:strand:- start:34 stop:750 length:717 start_codon:yes stop_codon:yes gene_type:complete
MRIANRILSNEPGAEPYTYDEVEDYKTVIGNWGNPPGPPETSLLFDKGNTQIIQDQSLDLYESAYYSIFTNDPVNITVIESAGQLQLSSIIKARLENKWIVRSGAQLNIDPEIELDWISLVVSPIGLDNDNWDWTMRVSDGYSEDFTSFAPYPNPSLGKEISMDIQVITSQTITTRIFDVMGREVWSRFQDFNSPTMKTVKWNGKNYNGNRVSNGVYFIMVEGINQASTHKLVYIKKY